jgi:xanthine dehydrogenase YagS FAD-binding subunit
MIEFSYARAVDAPGAIRLSGAAAHPKYLGGGTNLVDLMRETVEQPDALIDVTGLSSDIEVRDDGSVLIGAAFLVHQIWRRL